MTKLIVLCDGTWCGAEAGTQTNIYLLAKMIMNNLDPYEASPYQDATRGIKACYFPGVGLGRTFLECLFNAATGSDIGRDCLDVYKYIVQHFDKDHEIWMFGLSRGAYTVRCVAGMINNCGILKRRTNNNTVLTTNNNTDLIPVENDLCDEVYKIYRSPDPKDRPKADRILKFKKKASYDVKTPVKFMGLFDTVGSLGIPKLDAGVGLDYPGFYDQKVSSVVGKVYHALSIHDRLWCFEPCHASRSKRNSKLEIYECWFPGCHYDLGRQKFRFLRENELQTLIERISGFAVNVGNAVTDVAAGTGHVIIGTAEGAGRAIIDTAADAGHDSIGTAAGAGHAVTNFAAGAGHAIFGPAAFIANVIIGPAANIGSAVIDFTAVAGNAVINAVAGTGNAVTNVIAGAGNTVTNVAESIGHAAIGTAGSIGRGAGHVIDGLSFMRNSSLLSKTVEPNLVFADYVLQWMLQSIEACGGLGINSQKVADLTVAMMGNTNTGSGDIYGDTLAILPGGNMLELLSSICPDLKILINALAQTRDRRISDDNAVVTECKTTYPMLNDEPQGVKTIGELGQSERYLSRTYERFEEFKRAEV
ncbi:hypothetical protein BGX26_002248 [Mortierella sp. AD094]|nr:hypothetical protein BGX26_002248 [Mortierella sp. AD094]